MKKLMKMPAIKFAVAGFLFVIVVAAGTGSSLAEANCSDIDNINALYQKFLDKFKTRDTRAQAIAAGKELVSKYGACEEVKEQIDYVSAKLKNPEWATSGYTRSEAMSALNEILGEIIGKYRKPFASLGSFYYTSANATFGSGTIVEIKTRRATYMNEPGPYDCQTYGVINTTQVFDLTDVADLRREPSANTENASILSVILRSKVGISSTSGYTYASFNQRNGVCSGRKPTDDNTASTAEIGIPYSRGKYVHESDEMYSRLRAVITRLVVLAKEK